MKKIVFVIPIIAASMAFAFTGGLFAGPLNERVTSSEEKVKPDAPRRDPHRPHHVKRSHKRHEARRNIDAARHARQRARRFSSMSPRNRSDFRMGNRHLHKAESLFRRGLYGRASVFARSAQREFNKVKPAGHNAHRRFREKARHEIQSATSIKRSVSRWGRTSANNKHHYRRGVGYLNKARGAFNRRQYRQAYLMAKNAKSSFGRVVRPRHPRNGRVVRPRRPHNGRVVRPRRPHNGHPRHERRVRTH
jgi:hypothetical protein